MSALEIERVAGLALIQDGGRPGRMREGVPAGGALVPELLAAANGAVGNAPDAVGIELAGWMELRARGAVTVATEDGVARRLQEGETLRIDGRRDRRVRYVAIAGGIEAPLVLGGRGALLGARIGRPLARGDRVASAGWPTGDRRARAPLPDDGPIRVVLGPDQGRLAADAITTLLSASFVISPSSDRTGTRLVGPPLARRDADDSVSAPMVPGAIEVPAGGAPIVLGPDHPTTGGYPVVGVVTRADLGRFHALPFGAKVRFQAVDSRLAIGREGA